MKHLLITLFLFSSLAAFGQASRISWANANQVSIANSDGTNEKLVPISALRPRVDVAAGQVTFAYDTGGPTMTAAQFLDGSGNAWGANIPAAMIAFKAAAPTSSGGGSGGGFTAATIGTAPSVPTSYTGASGTISTTNTIYMLMKNTGSAAATVTYGGQSFTLPANTDMEFPSLYDYTSNKYAPYAALSLDATGTTVKLYKTPKQ